MHHKMDNTNHKIALVAVLIVSLIIFFLVPEFFINLFSEADYTTPLIILVFIPGFFILLAIIEVLLSHEWAVSHLGKHSGFKGALWSFLLGSFLPGLVFLAFPLSAVLLKKGVSKFNVMLFISAWACFNITEEVFEIHFLGWKFFLLRFVITLPLLILIAFAMEKWGDPKVDYDKK